MVGTRPSFQFYPSDWRKDVLLQSCTIPARGLWLELICIAHECVPYGYLISGAKPIPHSKLARMVGISGRAFERLYAELKKAGVSSEKEDGTIYCRRMVHDETVRLSWRDRQAKSRTMSRPMSRVTNDECHADVTPMSQDSSSSSSSSKKEELDSESLEKTDSSVGRENLFAPVDIPPVQRKNGTRWPADAMVPDDWIDDAAAKRRELGVATIDLNIHAEMFANYWSAKTGAMATKLDWYRTWINWSLKAEGTRHDGKKTTAHDTFFAAARRSIQRLEAADAAAAAANANANGGNGEARNDHDPVVKTGTALLPTGFHRTAG